MNSNTHIAKSIQTKLSQLGQEIGEAKLKLEDLYKQKNDLTQKLKALTNEDVILTEHAMLRYIERVLGLDLEILKEEILGDAVPLIKQNGAGKYPVGNTHYLRVSKDKHITTVLSTKYA